ncbi:hypothetical protein K6Y31_19335 [Motilimonas cestriensis]|uniref:Uncharacterized protein n=1 Tax=Motilimonas cestriensis TaxID=2742685 RepID=A0ABS8WD13_9GAMM|nr:hypothetical protein [Motilimonas cestriensis]MCE2596932.1 hypothetical protein [Motilimonas cestriensis]
MKSSGDSSERSVSLLSEALYIGVAGKNKGLTAEQWQALWAASPQQGNLQSWVDFVDDALEQ